MILKNSFDGIKIEQDQNIQILDVFFESNGSKKIVLEANSNLKYAFVIENSSVDLEFDMVGEYAKLDLFGVFVGDVESDVITSLLASNTFANVRIFNLVKEKSNVKVDGKIFIGKNIEKVEGHLIEEQFLIGEPQSLFVSPILDVHSDDVKASHGAKIHSLDPQKLFYMMSKGLSLEEAQKLVIKSEIESEFLQLTDIDSDTRQEILSQILDSAFSIGK